MRRSLVVFAGGCLVVGQVWGADLNLSACVFPEAPGLPDADTASVEQLGTTGAEVRKYVAEMEGQLTCLDGARDALGEEITSDQQAMINSAYNSGVDALNAVAEEYNAAVKAYKARTD